MSSRKYLAALAILIIFFLFGYLLLKLVSPSPNLNLVVAPSAAQVILDGKKTVKTGNYHLQPGNHTLKGTMTGFGDVSRSFSVQEGSVTKISMVLNPNSDAGYAYLKAHPDEELLREQQGAASFKTNSQQITQANPIIKALPYIAGDNTFRIDYGLTADSNSNVPIYITGINQYAIKAAQNWMITHGYTSSVPGAQTIIEPLLNQLPYATTDFSLSADFGSSASGAPKLNIDATILLSQSDTGNEDSATDQYKQEALDYLSSLGVNPANYTINYTIQQP